MLSKAELRRFFSRWMFLMFYFANIKSPAWTCPQQKEQFQEMYEKSVKLFKQKKFYEYAHLIFHAIHFVQPYFAGWYEYVAGDEKFYNFVIGEHVGETPTTVYSMPRNFGFSHKIVKDVYIEREVNSFAEHHRPGKITHSQCLGDYTWKFWSDGGTFTVAYNNGDYICG